MSSVCTLVVTDIDTVWTQGRRNESSFWTLGRWDDYALWTLGRGDVSSLWILGRRDVLFLWVLEDFHMLVDPGEDRRVLGADKGVLGGQGR
jgi:hypothetical protein